MIRHLRDIYARRRGEELNFESGFTLIELLIVIVVLGILAATVIFALTGVTSSSANAACNSDAKTYEVAVAAYDNAVSNTGNTPPGSTADLTSTNFGGPFLHAKAANPAYVVAITGDTAATANLYSSTVPAGTPGEVFVGPAGSTLIPYDSQSSSNGCNTSGL